MKTRLRVASIFVVAAASVGFGISPASAVAENAMPWRIVSGFSSPNGRGFWLAQTYGGIFPGGSAHSHGDLSEQGLNAQIVGGAVTSSGRGYWMVGSDGGVFTFGDARFYGSMAGAHLNQPVVAMAATRTGKGYWLVASDGGVFTFGDAHFFGSAGNLALRQPIVGATASASGKGYRLVAADGGIFSFGDASFKGSFPSRGVSAADVVGVAASPAGRGYWIARSGGAVYGFGNVQAMGAYVASTCDPVAAIFANPHAVGYRLVMQSGATIPFGNAPGGSGRTGTPLPCPSTADVVTVSGRIGPLRLGVSTEADVRAHLGAPAATGIGDFGIGSYPRYRALGYNCSSSVIPGGIQLHAYPRNPRVSGPYCRTLFYVNVETRTLAGLLTRSNAFQTEHGAVVGMPIEEAARREARPYYPLGCWSGVNLGSEATQAQIMLFASGYYLAGPGVPDVVGTIGVDSNTNGVGVLFC